MTWAMPDPGSKWCRKSDGRIDTAEGHDGSKYVLMYCPETNRHWHIQIQNFYRKYGVCEE